jgi:hypothetical protein
VIVRFTKESRPGVGIGQQHTVTFVSGAGPELHKPSGASANPGQDFCDDSVFAILGKDSGLVASQIGRSDGFAIHLDMTLQRRKYASQGIDRIWRILRPSGVRKPLR